MSHYLLLQHRICILSQFLTHSQVVFVFFSSPVPFDEDDRDDSVWFLDHDYLENMYGMFKKVNGKSSASVS